MTSPAASLTTSSVTVNLTNPLTVSADAVIGLAFDFDLKDSVKVDGTGQITGAVTPTVSIKAVTPADADAYVDDFVAGVTTTATNSLLFGATRVDDIHGECERPDRMGGGELPI